MIKSKICDLLGIEYPIIQGGMAWIADASLAAGVSNAGGLGLISGIQAGTEAVREEIRKCKKLTDKPFGVNIMLQAPNAHEIAELVIEEGVKIVTTGAGSPAKYMEKWKAAGIKVIPVIPSIAYALKMEDLGADAIVAEGAEAGGHIGSLHTMALIPQIVDAVNIPVIAAGGFADGRGLAAALMLGACGIQMGTRFLVADECTAHDNYKDKVLKATDVSTMITGESFRSPVRCIKNPFAKKFKKMESDPNVSPEDIMKFGAGSLRKAAKEGDTMGSYMAGEIAGLVNEKASAKDIILNVVNGAEEIINKTASLLK